MQNPFQNALMQLSRANSVKQFPKDFLERISHAKQRGANFYSNRRLGQW